MQKITFLGSILVCFASIALIGCSGDTDGGEENFDGTQFVATDSEAGSISVEVNDTELPVSETSGFAVSVIDAQGNPVVGIPVACDSELGVAILEPTTGKEITDSYGRISGILGCKTPGSYQFGCRLPLGANKRKLLRIKCTGDVPAGFDGFPGAAGGNLGIGAGGRDVEDQDDASTNTVRLTNIIAKTVGGNSYQIDTVQGTCGSGTSATAEPFTDDSILLTIVNNSNSKIVFTSYEYDAAGADIGNTKFTSDPISFVCEVDGSGGSAQCSALFIQAKGTSTNKTLYGASSPLSSTYTGFKTFTFRVTGTSELTGEEVTVSGKTAFSFENYNACSQ